MAWEIIWTERAVRELGDVLEYWNHRNQSTTYSKKIRKILRQNLTLISLQPQIGRKTSYPKVLAKLMLEHFLIIYKIEKKGIILILNFWDCRQNPNLIPYL